MKSLTVGSYNIHRCVGADGRCNPERVAEIIRSLDVDIIALQEVGFPRWFKHNHSHSQLDYLAKKTGMHAICGRNPGHGKDLYGNALLSRLPSTHRRKVDLSVPFREPRSAIEAHFEYLGTRLRIIATHLGLGFGERTEQVKSLIKALDLTSSLPTILLGDFNDWLPFRPTLRALEEFFRIEISGTLRTFPARYPLFGLDLMWSIGFHQPMVLKTISTEQTRMASDHLPLVGQIEIAPGTGLARELDLDMAALAGKIAPTP